MKAKKKAMGGMMDMEGRALKRKTADAKGRAMPTTQPIGRVSPKGTPPKLAAGKLMPVKMKKGGATKKMKKGC